MSRIAVPGLFLTFAVVCVLGGGAYGSAVLVSRSSGVTQSRPRWPARLSPNRLLPPSVTFLRSTSGSCADSVELGIGVGS